jgi:hypothetical protein
MKRKEKNKKNSLFTSQIKLNRGDDTMEISITKVYTVGGKEFSTKEEAFRETAIEILKKHVSSEQEVKALVENADEVRRALAILKK